MSTRAIYPKTIKTLDDVREAIAIFERLGEPASLRVPVLRGVLDSRISYLDVGCMTPAKVVKAFLASALGPTLVLVGDDGDEPPVGPKGTPQMTRLFRWAAQIVIHGAGGEIEHYEAFVRTAEVLGRLLVIECPSDTIGTYQAAAMIAAPATPVFTIQPQRGQHHPRAPERVTAE